MSVSDKLLSLAEIEAELPSGWQFIVEAKEAASGEKRVRASTKVPQEEAVLTGTPKIIASFTFANFRDAFSVMTMVAFEAEAADHHPEWSNVYNRLSVALSTHTTGGVSAKDMALAQHITRFAKERFGVSADSS
mmetsp:Transcript_14028/g.44161  ORF Transcript_14028/g.44161 Transcript_14028/m.44161 type:complete len:134 (-) Transcript_14028:1305-1706(-)